jgi:hypothetical protein
MEVCQMPIDIAAIGTLATVAGSVINAAKSLKDLFSRRSGNDAEQKTLNDLQNAVNEYNARMRILAEQLEQSERLTRMVPAWLEVSSRMPMWKQASDLDDNEARTVLDELKRFIFDSTSDHFSGTFFHTDFDKLPRIPDKLNILRARLKTINGTLSPIAPGNIEGLRSFWPQLTTQFNDAVNAAHDIRSDAENIQGDLIRELHDAANVTSAS